ncbi:MAG: hypothetical protein QNI84_09355 [Henriciella sp.]|nr:hypothetical protein [Henriciella sp.]
MASILVELSEVHGSYTVLAHLSGHVFNMCGDEVSPIDAGPDIRVEGDADGT